MFRGEITPFITINATGKRSRKCPLIDRPLNHRMQIRNFVSKSSTSLTICRKHHPLPLGTAIENKKSLLGSQFSPTGRFQEMPTAGTNIRTWLPSMCHLAPCGLFRMWRWSKSGKSKSSSYSAWLLAALRVSLQLSRLPQAHISQNLGDCWHFSGHIVSFILGS